MNGVFFNFFLGTFLFIFVMILGIAGFAFSFKRRKKFAIKSIVSTVSIISLAFLVAYLLFTFNIDKYPLWVNVIVSNVSYLLLFASIVIAVYLCFEEDFVKCLMVSSICYVTQNISNNIYGILVDQTDLETKIVVKNGQYSYIYCVLIQLFIAYILISLVFMIMRNKVKTFSMDKRGKANMIAIISCSLLVVIGLDNIKGFLKVESTERVIARALLIITCVLLLMLYLNVTAMRVVLDNYALEKSLLRKEKENYLSLKENIDMVNVKIHDIKHMIQDRENDSGIDFSSVLNAIDSYQCKYKTGNNTVDIILEEKSSICKRDDIELKCDAYSQNISFMSEEDIYSLLSNALSNAIEASTAMEKEKRIISLFIKERADHIFICIKNYTKNDIKVKNGRLLTSKEDKMNHGFGTISMKMIVEKYHGNISYDLQDDLFLLSILIPIKQI